MTLSKLGVIPIELILSLFNRLPSVIENELQLDVLLIFDFKDKDDIVTLGNSATYNMCRT